MKQKERYVVRVATAGLGAMLCLPLVGQAADEDGSYSVRGAGSQSCEQIAELAEAQPEEAALLISWLDGYTSAVNRLQPETYHATPFVGSLPLANVVLNVCANRDSDSEPLLVESITAGVLERLHDVRETRESQILELEHAGNSVSIREDSLRRVQERLGARGLYSGGVDGLYGPGTRGALESFQHEAGLPVSGLPDPDTLLQLLIQE